MQGYHRVIPKIAPCLDIALDAADLNGEHLKLCVKGHTVQHQAQICNPFSRGADHV